MDNNKHIRLDHNDHITKDAMIRYASGDLSAREKHQVEKHTTGCDLCADALEGVMAMKDTSSLKGVLEKIDRRVLTHEEKRTGPAILWMDTRVRVAAAAGAALLIGCIWFFNRNLDNGLDKTVSQTLPVNSNPIAGDSIKMDPKNPGETSVTGTTDKTETKTENQLTSTEGGAGGKTIPDADGDQVKDKNDQHKYSLTETNRKDSKAPLDNRLDQKDDLSKTGDLQDLDQNKDDKIVSTNGEVLKQENEVKHEQTVLKDLELNEKTKNKEEDVIVSTQKNKDADKKNSGKKENDEEPNSKTNSNGSFGFSNVPQTTNGPPPVQDNKSTVNGNVTTNSQTENNTDVPKKQDQVNDGYYKSPVDSVSKPMVMMDSLKQLEVNDGVKKFDEKDYTSAETKFRSTLKTDPKNRESLYYLGATYLAQDKPALAIEQFDKVIALGKGAYFDESRYKKSEALMKQSKKSEAKKILDELIKEGGPMKPKAVDLEKKD
jgi:hypothetical protein